MISRTAISAPETRSHALRWGFSALAAILAHGFAAMLFFPAMNEADSDAGSPAVYLELAPVAVAPDSTPSDAEPGPPQAESEQRDRIDETVQKQPDTPPPDAPEVNAEDAEPAPPKRPDEVAPQQAQPQTPQEEAVATAPPDVPERGEQSAAPAPGRADRRPSVADLQWQRQLVARLERSKRYPREASGRSGVARVQFRIDRNGHMLASEIVESSGSAILDAATLALLKRAEPFPPPPQDLADNQLVFIAPIRYAASSIHR